MLVEHIDDAVVVEVARGVIRQVAPQEMPLFRANSELYRKDPQKALRGASAGDQILGFGAGIDVTLLTPFVLAVVSEVLRFLSSQVVESAKHEGGSIVEQQVKRLFSRFRTPGDDAPQAEAPKLTQAQLARVSTIAYEAACRLKLSPDQARLLADSTVGGLVVG